MSVEATAIIAEKMYEVACLPRMPEEEIGLQNLMQSARSFCHHPDSRVRHWGCKTIASVARGYTDILISYPLDWLPILRKTMANGLNDGDPANAAILQEAMNYLGLNGEKERTPFASPLSPTPEPEEHKEGEYLDDQVDNSVPSYITEERTRGSRVGTVLLRVSSDDGSDLSDEEIRVIQNKLVTVAGVVSASFNADFLMLSIQGCLKKDAPFFLEISGVISLLTQGRFKCAITDEEKAAVESTKAGSEAADTSYLDDDERLAVRAGIKDGLVASNSHKLGFFSTASSHYVKGLNTAVSYAKDLELIEYHKENQAAVKEQVKQEETKKKISFFKRWFGRG